MKGDAVAFIAVASTTSRRRRALRRGIDLPVLLDRHHVLSGTLAAPTPTVGG
jgi:hypothetical protein